MLRDEWGFRGMAITDFFRNNGHGFMNADAALANGVDGMLATVEGGPNFVTDRTNPSSVTDMRRACKNVMYTVVSSYLYDPSYNSQQSTDWRTFLYIADAVAAVVLLGLEVLVLRNYKKRKKDEAAVSGR